MTDEEERSNSTFLKREWSPKQMLVDHQASHEQSLCIGGSTTRFLLLVICIELLFSKSNKMKVVAVVLFSVVACCSAINVQQCTGTSKAIENLSERVTIGNCKKPPCRLRKNTAIDINIKFKPEFEVKQLTTSVNAIIVGVPFPFVGVDGASACDNIYKEDGKTKVSCPLKAGEEYVYKNKIDVLQIYPRVKIVVHWALNTPNGDVSCFEVPARITN